jgi:hypothetical protein
MTDARILAGRLVAPPKKPLRCRLGWHRWIPYDVCHYGFDVVVEEWRVCPRCTTSQRLLNGNWRCE